MYFLSIVVFWTTLCMAIVYNCENSIFKQIHTFFRSFPLIWHNLLTPSKHIASNLPFPNILVTCAYSWPSSLKTNSLFSVSFSFFPLLRFLPPFPRKFWKYSFAYFLCHLFVFQMSKPFIRHIKQINLDFHKLTLFTFILRHFDKGLTLI